MQKENDLANLGPLQHLVGIWEGEKGIDQSPNHDRRVSGQTVFRERMEFEPTGRVQNHQQMLYGLRYKTTAWPIGAEKPFHEELGYWLWDRHAKTIIRCFIIPRGVTIIAGGRVEVDARTWRLTANLGSPTHGICSNEFLHKEFRTERYELVIKLEEPDQLSYSENTMLRIKDNPKIFNHTDSNSLERVRR